MLSQFVSGGIKSVLSDSTESRPLKTCTWFPLNLIPCAFPIIDFALYLLSVVNYQHEYDYMLSPLRLPVNH